MVAPGAVICPVSCVIIVAFAITAIAWTRVNLYESVSACFRGKCSSADVCYLDKDGDPGPCNVIYGVSSIGMLWAIWAGVAPWALNICGLRSCMVAGIINILWWWITAIAVSVQINDLRYDRKNNLTPHSADRSFLSAFIWFAAAFSSIMALGLWRNYYRTDWTQRFGARAPPPPPPAHAVASVTVMPTAGYDGKPASQIQMMQGSVSSASQSYHPQQSSGFYPPMYGPPSGSPAPGGPSYTAQSSPFAAAQPGYPASAPAGPFVAGQPAGSFVAGQQGYQPQAAMWALGQQQGYPAQGGPRPTMQMYAAPGTPAGPEKF